MLYGYKKLVFSNKNIGSALFLLTDWKMNGFRIRLCIQSLVTLFGLGKIFEKDLTPVRSLLVKMRSLGFTDLPKGPVLRGTPQALT